MKIKIKSKKKKKDKYDYIKLSGRIREEEKQKISPLLTSDNPAAALCVTHHASRGRQGDGRWAEQRRFLGHSSFIPLFLLFIAVYSSCVFPLFLFYFFKLIVSLCWMGFRVLSRRVSRWRQGGWPEGRTAVFPRL